MYLKIHQISGSGTITAVCDADLIGRTLTSVLCDITIDPSFYGDTLVSETEVLAALREASNANIIGEKVCALAIGAGLITRESCLLIEGIPHAQIYGV